MFRTFEAVYTHGQVVPLEVIDAEEHSKLLVVVLDNQKGESKSNDWKSLKGKYKGSLSSVDEFIARKQIEKNLEM